MSAGVAGSAERHAPGLTDDELFDAFHDGTLAPEGFDHRQHVRLAWVCLRRRPLPRVLEGFPGGLVRLAEKAGQPGHYHQTITWTYLLLVAEALEREGAKESAEGSAGEGDRAWDRFAASHPHLVGPSRDLLATLYPVETLASDLARRSFVLPRPSLDTPPS